MAPMIHNINKSIYIMLPNGILGLRDVIPISIFYIIGAYSIYTNEASQYLIFLSIVLLSYQFVSFEQSIYIFMMAIFFPFFYDLLGTGIFRFPRLAFIPFFILSLNKKKIRKTNVNDNLYRYLILVIIMIKSSYDFVHIFIMSDFTSLNFFASYYDLFTIISFFFIIYTKLSFNALQKCFNILILFFLLMSVSVIIISLLHYQALFLSFSGGFVAELWNSKLFNHKQVWGPVLVLAFFISLYKIQLKSGNSYIYTFLSIIIVIALFISLSRIAYIALIVGTFYNSALVKNRRMLLILIIASFTLFLIQPYFLISRVEGLFNAIFVNRSFSEFQDSSSGHFSDNSIQQIIQNLRFIPRVLSLEYQSNISESFLNGILYQTGIIGVLIVLLLLYKINKRFIRLSKYTIKSFSLYSALWRSVIVSSIVLMTTTRDTFFINYYGIILTYGFILLFLVFYGDVLFYESKKHLRHYQIKQN
jgi:hypothetical protein